VHVAQMGMGVVTVAVRHAALPCHKREQPHDPHDCRCGDEEVDPSAPLRLDQRKNDGAQPSCRQRGAVEPCRNTRRTAYRCP